MDMLKIIASVFVFAVCAFEGNRRTREMRERVLFLAEISGLIERFESGIRSAERTTDELLGKENGRFALLVKEYSAQTGDIRDGWRKACETLSKYAEETAVLEELGKTLGSFDKESTLAHLKRSAEEIAELRKTAEEEYARRGKPLSRVWTLCGLGLAILII